MTQPTVSQSVWQTMKGNTMDTTTNVTPSYIQIRQTKLGRATVKIIQSPSPDIWDASVIIVYKERVFEASALLSDVREAFFWAYGVKQATNDAYAGYQLNDGMLIETHPPKNRAARVLTVSQALSQAQSNYDNFELSKSSAVGDNVSIKSLTTSKLLSDEDKAVMATILAKLGKVTQ